MWVWSDELANRFPAMSRKPEAAVPLIAYAVDQETDLEDFAREILDPSRWLRNSQRHEQGIPSIPEG